jgi:hypothetical protein
MATAATTTEKKDSWWPLLWGLAAFLVGPYLPYIEAIAPIQQSLLLLVTVIAACAIVGWRLGARAALAVIWLVLSLWLLLQPAGSPGSQYDMMARGWALLLAASFGLVSLWNDAMPFFTRALFTVGLALGVGLLIALSSSSGMARFEHAAGEEFARRASSSIQLIQDRRSTTEWQDFATRFPGVDAAYDDGETMMRALPARSAPLLASLLALESLVALGLGWAVYRRLSTIQIGPPLGRLIEFRFNDQLIWGLAVGATLCLLPQFEEGRNAGYNLLLFFGMLYLLRGTGVLGWMLRGRWLVVFLLSLYPPVYVALTLGLGLGDTWLDLRNRVKTTSQ